VDIPFEEPVTSDLVLDSSANSPEELLAAAWHAIFP
jgi:hypothetical protein